ncbi:MAG: glycosyltransferase family 39 protein [Kiritimatiellae bacterium]|nr:glycosyltransferase family 39 protein [Kiritimatiellia bacterium]
MTDTADGANTEKTPASPGAGPSSPDRMTAVWVKVLFALAVGLRLVYAFRLPLSPDEHNMLHIASRISLNPGHLHLPLGSNLTVHPLMAAYLTALGLWAGRGSVFAVRLVFILLSTVGLAGILQLTKRLFGMRAAVIALGLAAVDRYLIAYAPVFIETAGLFLVPWILLFTDRALAENRSWQWLALGALFGIAYLFYEIYLLLLVPFAVCAALRRKWRAVVTNPAVYLGAAAFAVLTLPSLLWELTHESANLSYVRSVCQAIGVTPRFLLLVLGDILLEFKSATWILISRSNGMYPPSVIPCHWAAGLAYLGSLLYAFGQLRRKAFRLPVLAVVCVGLFATIVKPAEPWNNFWWANAALPPLIALAGYVASKITAARIGRVAAGAFGAWLAVAALLFLAGPKFTYTSLSWEARYLSRMSELLNRGNGKRNDAARAQARALNDAMRRQHPNSLIVHHFRAVLAADSNEWHAAIRAAKAIDPDDPAIALQEVKALLGRQERAAARALLRSTVKRHPRTFTLQAELANLELLCGDNAAAERSAMTALALKPDTAPLYAVLFSARENMGRREDALAALRAYAGRFVEQPYQAYVKAAETFRACGQHEKAVFYYGLARQMEPALPAEPPWLGKPGRGAGE